MAKRGLPRPQGKQGRIEEGSSVPLPIPLSEAKPCGYTPIEVNERLGTDLKVEIIGGQVRTPDDFDLPNYLAWRAMVYCAGAIIDPEVDMVHEIPVRTLKEYIEPDSKHQGVDTVKRAIAAVAATKVDILWTKEGKQYETLCNLAEVTFVLDKTWSLTINGTIRFRFPEPVRWLLAGMGADVLWTRVEMLVLNRFGSTHEARLYEFLSRFVNRRCRFTTAIPTDELLDTLAIGADSCYRRDWNNVRRRILDKVKGILDEHGAFTFTYEETRQGRGGKVTSIKFFVDTKESQNRLTLVNPFAEEAKSLIAIGR